MLVRNISHERAIASPTHDFYTGDIPTGGTVEVPDALGESLCEQVDNWEQVAAKPAKNNTNKATVEGDDN